MTADFTQALQLPLFQIDSVKFLWILTIQLSFALAKHEIVLAFALPSKKCWFFIVVVHVSPVHFDTFFRLMDLCLDKINLFSKEFILFLLPGKPLHQLLFGLEQGLLDQIQFIMKELFVFLYFVVVMNPGWKLSVGRFGLIFFAESIFACVALFIYDVFSLLPLYHIVIIGKKRCFRC